MTEGIVVSADSHVLEPPDLWQRYIDPRFREIAPRYVREGNNDIFTTAESRTALVGTFGAGGKPAAEVRREGTIADSRRGGYVPEARLADMDLDGVDAEILFPSLALDMMTLEDLDYARACREAYHRWLEEFCQIAPERLKPAGMITIEDVSQATQDVSDLKRRGFATAMITAHSYDDKPFYDPLFDPFWAVAQETRMPVSLHIGTERKSPLHGRPPTFVESVLLKVPIQRALAELILGGVLDRFPALQVVSVENDAAWAAAFYERMDEKFAKYTGIQQYHCAKRPSSYGQRNVCHTFITDHAAITARYHIGVDNLMWSSDYPHFDGSFPHSRAALEDHLGTLPSHERAKIQGGNAARVFGVG